jgi:hypothetical protein
VTRLDKDAVLAALRAEDVASHIGIKGTWRGLWMRSRRCAETDHPTDCFGIKRDGHWHCWSCDKGGDLLGLVALAAGLNLSSDFPRVLAAAAEIAGLDDDDSFGAPAPKRPRPELPPEIPIEQRIATARKRAAWTWDRLHDGANSTLVRMYLEMRGLDPDAVQRRETLRSTPLKLDKPTEQGDLYTLWRTMRPLSLVIPVRSVVDGAFVDLRARRVEPEEGQPKIVGMVGGVTTSPAMGAKSRELVGCYGVPNIIFGDLVVVVEGALDYLTGLQLWPNAQILGATEAGSFSLVAKLVAQQLAWQDDDSRLLIVEQADPPRTLRDGSTVAGAADGAINEDPNAAAKVALRHLGPKRVGWLYCGRPQHPGCKDLNDLLRIEGEDCVRDAVTWSSLASEG